MAQLTLTIYGKDLIEQKRWPHAGWSIQKIAGEILSTLGQYISQQKKLQAYEASQGLASTFKGPVLFKMKMYNFPPTCCAIYNSDLMASSSAEL